MEAVDAGDHERLAELRKQLDYSEWCVRLGEAGLRHADVAGRVRRRAVALTRAGQGRERRAQPLPGAAPVQHHRHRDGRPDGDGLGDRGAEAAAPATARDQRGDLVPAVQRARRRLRRRRPLDPGGARRRRVGRQRAEGVDDAGARSRSGGCCWPAPTPTSRSTAGSPTSSSTCTRPASPCGRWCRSPATPSSTRCSSTTPASPTRCASGPRATAGGSASRRS